MSQVCWKPKDGRAFTPEEMADVLDQYLTIRWTELGCGPDDQEWFASERERMRLELREALRSRGTAVPDDWASSNRMTLMTGHSMGTA